MIENDFLDPTDLSNFSILKISSGLVNIYIGLTNRLIAFKKLDLQSATRDSLAIAVSLSLIR
jgi:hypothetical protein